MLIWTSPLRPFIYYSKYFLLACTAINDLKKIVPVSKLKIPLKLNMRKTYEKNSTAGSMVA